MKRKIAADIVGKPKWIWRAVAAPVCVVAIGAVGFLCFANPRTFVAAAIAATSSPASSADSSITPASSPIRQQAATQGENLAAENIPLISDQLRLKVAHDYPAAPGFKALAISSGPVGLVTGQASEDAAKTAAVEACQKTAGSRKCELYAVGDLVVYAPGRPPLPSPPWIKHDPSIEKPFAGDAIPLSNKARQEQLQKSYGGGAKAKALALGPKGQYAFFQRQGSTEEATRRALESCGLVSKAACIVLALDDTFVAPLPTTLKPLGFFQAADNSMIAAGARDEVARQLAQASSGWNAVAVGKDGRPGLALRAASEDAAINDALGECAKHDSDCHVIAMGPFSVGPN